VLRKAAKWLWWVRIFGVYPWAALTIGSPFLRGKTGVLLAGKGEQVGVINQNSVWNVFSSAFHGTRHFCKHSFHISRQVRMEQWVCVDEDDPVGGSVKLPNKEGRIVHTMGSVRWGSWRSPLSENKRPLFPS
jgi:hypothetical protein